MAGNSENLRVRNLTRCQEILCASAGMIGVERMKAEYAIDKPDWRDAGPAMYLLIPVCFTMWLARVNRNAVLYIFHTYGTMD